jgi:ATP-dependent exoDNAse (exonuclease V) beta subunit
MPDFTSQQEKAAKYKKQDACVVAGPGSGKTTVLVERFRRLVEDFHFDPWNILAITFTEKAAANMKARLAEKFAHDEYRTRDMESAWVSTIHGFCARLLRENAIAAGIDPRFRVLDARESEDLQNACINAALDEFTAQRRAEVLELIDILQTPYIAGELRNAYDAMRSAGMPIREVRAMPNPGDHLNPQGLAQTLFRLVSGWPKALTPARERHRDDILEWGRLLFDVDATNLVKVVEVVKACPIHRGKMPESEKEALGDFKEKVLPLLVASVVDQHTAPYRALIFDVLARFEELYASRKSALGALDFSDLERLAVALLREHENVRTRVQGQFCQVMLDEFQDINRQQSELIQLIRGEDVFFAVGDINQSIYGFRHARPEIFREYEAHITTSGKHSASLLHNFRSRNEILRCVEALLNSAEGIEPRELVAGTTFADKAVPSIEVLKVIADGEDEEPAVREARWIAHRIRALHGALHIQELVDGQVEVRVAEYRDFAVLCRNGESMKPILEAFGKAHIPYVSGRRESYLLSREGRDITALLHTIANPRDAVALTTVLRSPFVGLSDEGLLRLRLTGHSVPGGVNMIAFDRTLLSGFTSDDAGKLERFSSNLRRWRGEQPVLPLEVLIVRALGDCGFEWLPGTGTANNIESYLHTARTRGPQRDLNSLLREIESLEDAFDLESELADRDQGNAVQVITAHAAKGLEFPITIITAMDKGTQRNSSSITFTPEYGLGLSWKDKSGNRKNGLADSWQLRNGETISERETQESNRLLYVAMTRAEEHLILSYSRGKNRPSNWAKIVDNAFGLDGMEPAAEPYRHSMPEFDVSVYVANFNPPEAPASSASAAEGGGIETVARPNVTGQYDSAINVTSLAVFADCPRKYYLQRYIGWNGRVSFFDAEDNAPDVEDEGFSAADLGSAVHEILAGKEGDYPADAERLADVFRKSELGSRAAASKDAGREWEFIVDLDGTLVRGTVDLWFRENGEVVIVDYKTDRNVHTEAYAPQLSLYAIAIERAFGQRPSHAYLHFLRADQVLEVPPDYDVYGLLTRLRDAQENLRFDLNAGPHCRTCQYYRSMCPSNLSPGGF